MTLRDTGMAALVFFVASVAAAQAQMADFPPVGQQASPFPPPPGQPARPSAPPAAGPGFSGSGFGQPEKPPCYDEFVAHGDEIAKRFDAAQGGINKRLSAKEICGLLTKLSQSENKAIKFVQQNTTKCGFPPEILQNVKMRNAKTEEFRKQACTAAARPARPAEPTLSDALSAPAVGKDNTKTGGGTLDSLFGNPLAR
jgi:hypothetical protein